MSPKYAIQTHRNYEMFKRAITDIVARNLSTEKEEDEHYYQALAVFYGLNTNDFKDDPIGLEQAIEDIKSSERKNTNSEINAYYNNQGL